MSLIIIGIALGAIGALRTLSAFYTLGYVILGVGLVLQARRFSRNPLLIVGVVFVFALAVIWVTSMLFKATANLNPY